MLGLVIETISNDANYCLLCYKCFPNPMGLRSSLNFTQNHEQTLHGDNLQLLPSWSSDIFKKSYANFPPVTSTYSFSPAN